jgi:hypothetical protein
MNALGSSERLFDRTPGPSPWYLIPNSNWYSGTYSPKVDGFFWEPSELSHRAAGGKTLLVGSNGPVAVLGYYNYVMALDDSKLLVWNQSREVPEGMPTPPIRLFVIEPNRLRPLQSDLSSLYERMNFQNEFIALGGDAVAEMRLSSTNVTDNLSATFPEFLQSTDELLILCHSSGIPKSSGSVDLALMVANPRLSSYRLYPQDWFNNSGLDFGYQWVTRVARNPDTGNVHGEGFRIKPFILDDSLRMPRTENGA